MSAWLPLSLIARYLWHTRHARYAARVRAMERRYNP